MIQHQPEPSEGLLALAVKHVCAERAYLKKLEEQQQSRAVPVFVRWHEQIYTGYLESLTPYDGKEFVRFNRVSMTVSEQLRRAILQFDRHRLELVVEDTVNLLNFHSLDLCRDKAVLRYFTDKEFAHFNSRSLNRE